MCVWKSVGVSSVVGPVAGPILEERRVRLPRLTYQAGRRRDAQSLAVLWRGPRFGQEWLHGKRLLLVTVFMRGRAQSFADLRDSRLNDVFN